MQITFLVGNGFDISCGIDTSYIGFYNWYLKQASKSDTIKAFKNSIRDDLELGGKNWSDFEAGLGKYTKHFSKETAQEFRDLYEDAYNSIIKYIDSEQKKFDATLLTDDVIDFLKRGILDFYFELPPETFDLFTKLLGSDQNSDTFFSLISFNYSNIIDTCIEKMARTPLMTLQHEDWSHTYYLSPPVIHVHGTINQYPILGVSEEYQFENKELLECSDIPKIMIKSKSVRALGMHWYSFAVDTINSSTIICIWGMSIGDTDSFWWSRIIEWLQEDDSRQLIIFWQINEPSIKESVVTYFTEKSRVIERFMQFSSCTREEIDKLSDRINVIFNTESVLRLAPNN